MNTSLPEILSTEIGYLLEPLKRINSARELSAMVRKLGWDFTGALGTVNFGPLVTSVENMMGKVSDLAQAGEDSEKVDALLALLEQIALVITELNNSIPGLKSAIESAPNVVGEANIAVDDLMRRVIDCLVSAYLEEYRRDWYGITQLLELVTTEEDTQSHKTYYIIHWDRLGDLFSNPVNLFNEAYQWSSNFDAAKFLARLEILATTFDLPGGIYKQADFILANLGRQSPDDLEVRIPVYQEGNWGENWQEIDLNISPIPASGNLPAGLLIYPYFFGSVDLNSDISESWILELLGQVALGSGLGLEIRPPAQFNMKTDLFSNPLDSVDLNVELSLQRKDAGAAVVLFGNPNASFLSYENFTARVFAKNTVSESDLGIEMQLASLKLAVNLGNGDGLLQKIMPDGFETTFDLGLGYSLVDGFYFAGTGTFELYFSTHIKLGPLEIRGLSLGLAPDSSGLRLSFGSTIKLDLGPFVAIVENLGLNADLEFPGSGGNLGPVNYGLSFKPPTGVALSLETSVVKGGGYLFFDTAKEEYGGALELCILDKISITAIGIVSTIYDEDGKKNYSLLLIISVSFSPGIALGMGFFLTGLGGMLGIHRTVNTDALVEGVKNNALDHILFPENIIENIDVIIGDIKEIFPPLLDQFLVGLMAKISFGSPEIITVEFGLMVEFPNPVRVVILGVIKMILPDPENTILQLQINFVGILDFEAKYISFDATIYNSRILTITLEGDMAFRLFWGAEKAFLLSVGGFHPSFQPSESLKVGNMKRITASLLSGNPSLSLSCYFALTSNTVQFGSSIDFYYEKSGFKVIGYFGFDALFQFSPFWFTASIGASVAIKKGSNTLMSISLAFSLEGPTPWIVEGTAEFKVLVKIKVKINKTWGEKAQVELPKVAILPQLIEAFEQVNNWTSEIPEDQFLLVTLSETELAEGTILLHSSGTLTIAQDVLPLQMIISKFGNDVPSDIEEAWIDSLLLEGEAAETAEVSSAFAPAAFQNYKNKEKLSAPSYTEETSGVEMRESSGRELNYAINRVVEYEMRVSDFDTGSNEVYDLGKTKKLDRVVQDRNASLTTLLAKNGIARGSVLSKEKRTKGKRLNGKAVSMQKEQYRLVHTEDLSLYGDIDFNGGSKAQAYSELERLLQQSPELRDKIQVMPAYELAV